MAQEIDLSLSRYLGPQASSCCVQLMGDAAGSQRGRGERSLSSSPPTPLLQCGPGSDWPSVTSFCGADLCSQPYLSGEFQSSSNHPQLYRCLKALCWFLLPCPHFCDYSAASILITSQLSASWASCWDTG